MVAASNNHEERVRFLLETGADVNAKTTDGKTPLMRAVSKDQSSFSRPLCLKGADQDARKAAEEEATLQKTAALRAQVETTRLLLEKGADVNARTDYGATALSMAAKQKAWVEVVELLLEGGAQVDTDGNEPLVAAVRNKQEELVKLFLAHGAKVNAKDPDQKTALMHATEAGDGIITKLLLQNGADVNAKDKNGETALMAAAWYGNSAIAELLLQKGARVDTHTPDGETAILLAKRENNEDVVRLLRERGARLPADANAAPSHNGAPAPLGAVTATTPQFGQIPPQDIQRVLRAAGGRFGLCYEQSLYCCPNLDYRITLRFVIGKDGSVTKAKNVDVDLSARRETIECAVQAVRGLTFPKPNGGPVTVVYPWWFGPGQ
jgi:ankyrin repeat protein